MNELEQLPNPVVYDPEEDPDFVPGAVQIVDEDGQLIEEITDYIPEEKELIIEDLEDAAIKEQSISLVSSNTFDWDLSLSDLTVVESLLLIGLSFAAISFVLFKRWGD